METKPKPRIDILKRIKHIAYCLAFKPPLEDRYTFADLLRHAKFRLSLEKKVLLNDPIWDQYTDEQILVEYYAIVFTNSSEEKTHFEASLSGMLPEEGSSSREAAIAWMDEMIAKEDAKRQAAQAGLPAPQSMGSPPQAQDRDKIKEFSEFEEFEFVPPGK